MTRNKLWLAQLRRSPQKAYDIQSLAKRLGRVAVGKRGKEPVWQSTEFTELFVLSIQDHGGKDLAIGTKNAILDQLEDDIAAWETRLGEEEDEQDDDGDQDMGVGNGTG
jgi:hypothetical protein